ncbi:hypothetical protein C8R45DRAFT_936001 [Mycena sanguinolenta]|nr:hypothetical protein C8R45DRAFT_936001 [Mycena sanguinolenta]
MYTAGIVSGTHTYAAGIIHMQQALCMVGIYRKMLKNELEYAENELCKHSSAYTLDASTGTVQSSIVLQTCNLGGPGCIWPIFRSFMLSIVNRHESQIHGTKHKRGSGVHRHQVPFRTTYYEFPAFALKRAETRRAHGAEQTVSDKETAGTSKESVSSARGVPQASTPELRLVYLLRKSASLRRWSIDARAQRVLSHFDRCPLRGTREATGTTQGTTKAIDTRAWRKDGQGGNEKQKKRRTSYSYSQASQTRSRGSASRGLDAVGCLWGDCAALVRVEGTRGGDKKRSKESKGNEKKRGRGGRKRTTEEREAKEEKLKKPRQKETERGRRTKAAQYEGGSQVHIATRRSVKENERRQRKKVKKEKRKKCTEYTAQDKGGRGRVCPSMTDPVGHLEDVRVEGGVAGDGRDGDSFGEPRGGVDPVV